MLRVWPIPFPFMQNTSHQQNCKIQGFHDGTVEDSSLLGWCTTLASSHYYSFFHPDSFL